MRFTKYFVTAMVALSLAILPVLPTDKAEAASNSTTYTYSTNYYYSYSVPVKYTGTTTATTTATTSYTLYYDANTGKYYLVQKPSTGNYQPVPVNPGQPGTPNKPAEPSKPSPQPQPSRPEQPKPQPPKPEQPKPQPSTPSVPVGNSQFEQQVIELVNQERAKAGLKPLVYDGQLTQVARLKSEDMRDNKYFSHTSPTYGSPFDMMKKYGVSYRTAGENIAAGQSSPQQVVQAWMNSPGHKANILSSQYNRIGVGYASGGSYGHYWTQMFIGQ